MKEREALELAGARGLRMILNTRRISLKLNNMCDWQMSINVKTLHEAGSETILMRAFIHSYIIRCNTTRECNINKLIYVL
jgi:hypothetical protein